MKQLARKVKHVNTRLTRNSATKFYGVSLEFLDELERPVLFFELDRQQAEQVHQSMGKALLHIDTVERSG